MMGKPVQFYCVKGKHKVKTSNYKIKKLKNGRKAYESKCPTHGTKLFRFAGSEVDSNI